MLSKVTGGREGFCCLFSLAGQWPFFSGKWAKKAVATIPPVTPVVALCSKLNIDIFFNAGLKLNQKRFN
jgi:hypothetical protein